jgi:tetratricopeptide (TPR) repeat protein
VREARTALAVRRRSLGDLHPETGLTLAILAGVLGDLERHEESEAAAREAFAILDGRDRFGALQARSTLAAALLRRGQAAEALTLFDQALAEHLALLPEEHPLVYAVRLHRMRALSALGRTSEARAALLPVLERLESKGPEHAYLRTSARELAALLEADSPAQQ